MGLRRGLGAVATALLCLPVAVGGGPPSTHWPTLQHDMARTGYTPACPRPPYAIRWVWANGARLYPGKVQLPRGRFTWEALPDFVGTRFMALAQPIVRDGVAYIGSIEGDLYAIDVRTGTTRWKAPASGPILHSVSVADDAVFAATLRGLDAFGLDGRKLWTFQDPHLGGFWCCPALARGLALAGSLKGYFHGIEARTGKARWAFRAGGPIYHTPAAHDGSVYFGAEDMHAYCLDAATGRPKWKSQRLHGVSFGHYWPVVAAKAGVVMFRTAGFAGAHHSGMRAVEKAPFDYGKAQEALRSHLAANDYARSFFVLDLADGRERVKVPSGYFGSQGDIPPPPIVRPDGSVLAYHYAKEGAMQQHGRWGGYGVPVDLGIIDFRMGRYRRIGPTGSTRPPAITRYDDFHQITMGGNYLFGIQHGLEWGCVPLDGKGPTGGGNFHHHVNRFRQSGKRGTVGYLGRNEHGAVAPTILPDVVLVNPMNGVCIIAYESKGGK